MNTKILSMTDGQKNWIDNANYYELLKRWRFAEGRDNIFQGASGVYYAEVMNNHKKGKGSAYHTKISKLIGWDK